MKVFSIAVALSAILFVAYAFPQDYEEEAGGEEGGEEGEGGEEAVTPSPCQQFEDQCQNNEGSMNGQNGTIGQTANPQCPLWKEQCNQQNGGSTMPGGVTQPTQPAQPTQPTAPEMANMTTPAATPPTQNTTMPGGIAVPGRR